MQNTKPVSSPVASDHSSRHQGLFLLVLGALGVVYGDIGTSPLYAVNEIFFGHTDAIPTAAHVVDGISLVFWALTLVVAIKYVFFVLRADSEGEGGVFALYNLIRQIPRSPALLLGLLVVAAGLLYGDGIITPAISVISAVEGLKLITPSVHPFIVPITIAILTGLFTIQKNGTHKVGTVLGPIMVIWFSVIGVLGARSVMLNPSILMALNPIHAVDFVMSSNIPTLLLTLGSVMLVITGGEAMYADMGHFGKKPIQLGWYLVAYPMLVANYLGQGAYLISGKPVLYENVFYSMVPQQALIPMVILSTFATIIASQALISGAFSLTMQAISLRLLPYMHIKHTHEAHEGQVYMPDINWALYIGAVLLVIVFGSSSGLAGAYGLAVSGVMFVTTLGIMTVARSLWKWHRWQVYLLFIPFACLDLLFLVANSMKLFEGGWIPLTIGLGIYALITTWQWGRTHTINTFNRVKTMTVKELVKLQLSTPNDLPRTMVFLTRKPIHTLDDGIPIQLERYWDRNASLPEHLVLLNVELLKTPHAEKRTEVIHFTPKESKSGSVTSLTVRFGFMEDPDLEPLVRRFIKDKEIPSQHPPEQWVFKVVHERVSLNSAATWWTKFTFQIYRFLQRNTQSADEYFGLGDDHMLTIDVYPVELS